MQSIPFNYISYFSFQIKNCKGKTDRLKLSVFDAFGGRYFLFVFLPCFFKAISVHFVENSCTMKNSFAFNSFPFLFFLKKRLPGEGRERGGCHCMGASHGWAGGDGSVLGAVPTAVGLLCPTLSSSAQFLALALARRQTTSLEIV